MRLCPPTLAHLVRDVFQCRALWPLVPRVERLRKLDVLDADESRFLKSIL
jgi:hypothetical protein